MRFHTQVSVIALTLCMLPGFAHAALIEASSDVAEATVYTDRALITRTAKVHVPAGAHTISITNMPAGMNEATLRVQGKSVAAVKIGTVEVKHEYLTEIVNAAQREKNAQIEAKVDQKVWLQGEIDAATAKRDFIDRIIDNGADKHEPNNSTKLDFAPEKWAQAWNLLQTGINESAHDVATKQIAMRKLDAEILALQQEISRLQTQQAKERRDARVNIEAASEADIDLTLSYQTTGALWRPVYDARLDTATGGLELEQYGQVTQSTGEDWAKVALTLSTAQPAMGSEMPRLNEWWVRLFQPYVAAASGMISNFASADAPMMRRADKKADYQTAMPEAAPAMAPPEPVEADQVVATAYTTDYSAEFKVPGRVDVKSTRDMTKLYLGALKMKAELAVQTSPRLGTQAYLFAKATNSETYPIIPGMVAKYRDGAFIGNANMPLVRADETANFSFGSDDRVKVEYKLVKDKHDNPTLIVMGDMTVERQYQAKVQNLHKDPIMITVFDQYPVAGDADVTVTLLDDVTTPNYVKDTESRQGVITWSSMFNPKEEKTYTLGFKVRYPKNKTVQGL